MDRIFYRNYEIDTTSYKYITVYYMGDDVMFRTVEEAKEFIDTIVEREEEYGNV